jgi:hypothetical protein
MPHTLSMSASFCRQPVLHMHLLVAASTASEESQIGQRAARFCFSVEKAWALPFMTKLDHTPSGHRELDRGADETRIELAGGQSAEKALCFACSSAFRAVSVRQFHHGADLSTILPRRPYRSVRAERYWPSLRAVAPCTQDVPRRK